MLQAPGNTVISVNNACSAVHTISLQPWGLLHLPTQVPQQQSLKPNGLTPTCVIMRPHGMHLVATHRCDVAVTTKV